MIKKFLVTFMSGLLIVSLISGCSNKQKNTLYNKTTSEVQNKTQETVKPITLNLAVAGDTNMVEFFQAISKDFESKNPNVSISVTGTGPGDPGSQAIFTKLNAELQAGSSEWDIDVAVVHQSIMGDLIKNNLIDKYVENLANKKYVTGQSAENALGTNVKDYVVPMFQSQIAIAYRPEVKNVPNNFDELVKWIKSNPNKFGYNGVKNGMSGVGFTAAWIYWKTGDYSELAKGPYSKELEKKWIQPIKELKALPITITNGNNGTLDMLNRGEIFMGPVWMDMYYTWVKEQRLDPSIKLKLISPGLPGQPMYFVVPAKAANKDAAIKFIDFMSSPDVQAKYIVERNGWLPGIDPNVVLPEVSEDVKKKLFETISPDDLAKNGLQFPLAPYLEDMLRAYESN